MREILFRGKQKDDDEWVMGYYARTWLANGVVIAEILDAEEPYCLQVFHEVMPETVGQYTGLTDKNGKRIFEGDILRFTAPNLEEPSDILYEVAYIENRFALKVIGREMVEEFDGVAHWYEIIGNIRDNPELMKGEKQ